MKQCVVFFTILDLVTGGRRFRERGPMSYVDWKQTKRVDEEMDLRFLNGLWDWPFKLEDVKFTESHQPSTAPPRMPYISSDIFYSEALKEKINDKLNQLDYHPNWKEKAEDYHWD